MQSETIICRCEELTEEEIRDAIRSGARSPDEIKKVTRAGMGCCQGKTCRRLIARILSEEMGMLFPEAVDVSIRMPVGPIPLELIACMADGAEDLDKTTE